MLPKKGGAHGRAPHAAFRRVMRRERQRAISGSAGVSAVVGIRPCEANFFGNVTLHPDSALKVIDGLRVDAAFTLFPRFQSGSFFAERK